MNFHIIKYKIQIENGIKRTQKNFENEVKSILKDKRSWPINFQQDQENYDIIINLSKPKNIENHCKFKGLSCTDRSNQQVYINNHRWCRGSKASKLSVKNYRKYVLQHELGHLLHLDHEQPEKGKKVKIMVQQTLNIGESKPNYWPTKEEIALVNKIWNS